MSAKILHSRPEAASLLCISLRKLDELIGMRVIASMKIGKRTLIPRSVLEGFVHDNLSATASPESKKHGPPAGVPERYEIRTKKRG